MKNYMKLEVAALSENESFARSAVAAFALSLNPTLSEISDIKTAVSEAVTNCVVHAYQNGEAGKIIIECEIEKSEGMLDEGHGKLHIRITDFGCGIDDIERATTPFYTTREDEERSGMGFTIMLTFMSAFSVESERGKGTVVSMSKVIGADENTQIRERVNA